MKGRLRKNASAAVRARHAHGSAAAASHKYKSGKGLRRAGRRFRRMRHKAHARRHARIGNDYSASGYTADGPKLSKLRSIFAKRI